VFLTAASGPAVGWGGFESSPWTRFSIRANNSEYAELAEKALSAMGFWAAMGESCNPIREWAQIPDTIGSGLQAWQAL
jgi:hypothetical protein